VNRAGEAAARWSAFYLRLPAGYPEKFEATIARAADQRTVKRHIAGPARVC
jgi:hypothetical protein